MAPAVDTARDSDYDGTPDVSDDCPYDFYKTAPGDCGCGLIETDTDNDGTSDCIDLCANDPNKTAPGNCGCDNAETSGCGSGGGGSQTPTDLDLGGGVTMKMVLIPAGTFMMGVKDEYCTACPQHQVTISKPFYLGKYEVTQAQWQAIMGTNPSYYGGGGNRPLENVTWDDCQTFCQKVSSKTGRTVRLPTEAEWEYACRAGTTTTYYFGDDASQLPLYAWYGPHSSVDHDVGGKLPNAWGLYDMLGDVYEFCQDWNGAYQTNELGGPIGPSVTDPTGPSSGPGRSIRGGSWGVDETGCTVTSRQFFPETWDKDNIGVRMAMDSK